MPTEHGRVILITDKFGNKEVWGSLTRLTKAHGIAYHYIKSWDYPFEYRGVKFERIDTRVKPESGHVIFDKAKK